MFEFMAWRWQLILTAHEHNSLAPDYSGSEYFDPVGSARGGVAPALSRTVAKQMNEDAEAQSHRNKGRELRRPIDPKAGDKGGGKGM